MNELETTATVVVGLVFLGFLTAWDSSGPAGQKYRDTVKAVGWFVTSLLTYPAGKAVGFVALMGSPFSKKVRNYRALRAYRGRHLHGMESALILAEC
jgi:hypothetical protein